MSVLSRWSQITRMDLFYMKYLFIFLSLLSIQSFASDSLELLGPGVTWHVIDDGASGLYSHKLSSDGRLVYTPMIGIRKTSISDQNVYNSLSLFTAQNSIGSPIYGGMGATGLQLFGVFDAGFVFGGYIQNNQDFQRLGIVPFSATGGENAFVPLMGLEFNVKIKLDKNAFLGINNTITPIITNHNISFGINY
jgi:hypothetical protein